MSLPDTVSVVPGALDALPDGLPEAPASLLLTDTNVEALLGAGCADLPRHVVPAGEASKSWDRLEVLLLALDDAGLDRDGLLVAVGGGVVTDLGGLAASLHRRGIRWVAVPTSLVGQADAAVGGKTAVNLGGGKNTVGTFHLPCRVLVDPRALATLPDRHLRAGLAEVLKTALIAGGALHEQVLAVNTDAFREARPDAVAILEGCLATKLRLVEDDLTDHGPRRLLNLGHTFGHAFEALAMPELLHGEAVGLGLLCAARLAAGAPDSPLERGIADRLAAWDLPTAWDAPPDAVLAAMRRDKKRRSGAQTMVVPVEPGRVEIREGVDEALLLEALEAVRPD